MESRMPPGCFSWDSGETLARNSPPTVSSGERHGRARRRGGGESARAGWARGLDEPARGLVVGDAGELGGGERERRAIRSEKARVCGFEPCVVLFLFPWVGRVEGEQETGRRWGLGEIE